MKDIYFLFQKKISFLETPFPLINDGIIVLANIGNKKLKIPLPFSSKVIFLSKIPESFIFSSNFKILSFLDKALLIP